MFLCLLRLFFSDSAELILFERGGHLMSKTKPTQIACDLFENAEQCQQREEPPDSHNECTFSQLTQMKLLQL